MMPRRVAVMCVAVLCSTAPAWAQTSGSDEFRGRLFVHFEGQAMTAKDSFDAVTGSTTMTGAGAGLEVQDVWRRLFIRGAISRLSKTGESVFVDDGEVFRLGTPLDITMTPIEVGAGWRFKPFGSRGLVPYAGAGVLILKHREEAEGDTASEGVKETYTGLALFGGLEVPVWRMISAGAELGWRSAKVKEPGGAMAAFGENNLGGVTFRVMISFRN
jgi:hypothetical protein